MTAENLEQDILTLRADLKEVGANEAETRLKIIDRVVFEILQWDRKDVTVESRVLEDGQTTITDYRFATATTQFIIEAKRIAIPFLEDVVGQTTISLSEKKLTGEFGKAVRQGRDYCRAAGIPFAAVTNGDSWFIYPAPRTDGISFEESSGIYFSSLETVLLYERDEFFALLSRDSVIGGSLDRSLLGTVENQIEQRRLNAFFSSTATGVEKANLYEPVENAFIIALNPEISSLSRDILQKAYVQTPSRVKFDQRIQMYVRRRENVTRKSPLRPMKRADAESFSDAVQSAAARTRPSAILLLGQVGAGKTTFLQYTFAVSSEAFFEKRGDLPYPQWIRIDFIPFSKTQNPRDFLMQALLRYIRDEPFLSDYERCVKHAFAPDIDGLFRGPLSLFSDDEKEQKKYIAEFLLEQYKKVEPYVLTVLSYAANNAAIFLVIDNVDQIEDQNIQEQIFREAMTIAHQCKLNLILAMRDATYVRNRGTPTFDAFDFDPVVIEPPPVEAVLSKRFAIAEELASHQSGDFVSEAGAKVHVSDLSTVVKMLKRVVLGTEIGRQIDVLATGDIRLALRMTREFLQYGYTSSAKSFRDFASTGKFQITPHEALRAIMLGNQTVYREKFSGVGNPLDAHLNRTEVQLSRLFILNALVGYATNAQFQFVTSEDILKNCRGVGLSDGTVLRVLEDLAQFRFIQTLSHGPATLEANYIPTRLGGYVIRHYLADPTFVETVMADTFITFDDAWSKLKELTATIQREKRNAVRRLALRKERLELFFQVMQQLYDPLMYEARRRALPPEWCSDPLNGARGDLVRELDRARMLAEGSYTAAILE